MPKRTDIRAFSSSAPARSSSARRPSLITRARRPARRCAKRLPRHSRQLESGHHHDRPGDGGRPSTSSPSTGRLLHASSRKSAPMRCCRRWAADGSQHCTGPGSRRRTGQYEVELIAASRAAIDMAEDRELFRNAMRENRLGVPAVADRPRIEDAIENRGRHGLPRDHPPVVHHGRLGRRHCLQPRRARSDRGPRARRIAHQGSAPRGVGDRLERV